MAMNHSSLMSEFDVDRQHFVDATIDVINASNLMSSVEVRGFSGIDIFGLTILGRLKRLKPRSYAFICTQNDVKEKSQQKPLVEFGKRMPDDILIQYRREYSNKGNLKLDFHDPYLNITYVLVNVNVRISYHLNH